MLNWQDQARFCELLVDPDGCFSENQMKILLENVVASVMPLRSVKYQHDQLFTHTGKILDFEVCVRLLLSASTGYDSQFASTSTRSTRR